MAASDERGRAPRRFGRLARDSAIFALGAAVGKVVAILVLPVVARSLTTAEFGRVDLLSTAQSAAASLVLLGMDLAATRLFAELGPEDRRRMFASWLTVTAALCLPMVAGAIIAARPLARWIFDDGSYGTAVGLTGAAILASAVQLVALTVLRNHRRPIAFAVVSGGTLVANGVLVVALVPTRPTATTVLFAMAVSFGVGAFAALALALPGLRARPSRPIGGRLLRLGLPLAPAVAATWIAELANRGVLIARTSPTEVAYFSMATRFSSVAVLVVLGFQMAWQPDAFGLGRSEDAVRHIARDGRRILTSVATAVVLLAACAPELVELLGGRAYRGALPAVGLALVFAVGYAAMQTSTMPSALGLFMRDVGASAVVAAVAGVVLNLWWARWGAGGTGAAVAVGQWVGVAVAFTLARRRATVPYPWLRMGALVAAASATTLAMTLPEGGAPRLVRGLLAVAFLVAFAVEGSLRDLAGAVAPRLGRPEPDPI